MKKVILFLMTIVMMTTITNAGYDPYEVVGKLEIQNESTTENLRDASARLTEEEMNKIIAEISNDIKVGSEKAEAINKIEKEKKKELEEAYVRNLSGDASFYGEEWNGRRTANGEIFNTYELTAAHKTLPFGTMVKIVNKTNGKSVIVRINDRGPYVKGRTIDLSKKAFQALASTKKGVLRDSEIDILVMK